MVLTSRDSEPRDTFDFVVTQRQVTSCVWSETDDSYHIGFIWRDGCIDAIGNSEGAWFNERIRITQEDRPWSL